MNDFRDCVRISSNGEKELSCSNKIACSASVSVTFRKEFSGRTKIGSRAVFAFATIFARPKKKNEYLIKNQQKRLQAITEKIGTRFSFMTAQKLGRA